MIKIEEVIQYTTNDHQTFLNKEAAEEHILGKLVHIFESTLIDADRSLSSNWESRKVINKLELALFDNLEVVTKMVKEMYKMVEGE